MDQNPSTASNEPQINPKAAPALHALLVGSIDYAGLFPPAELPLETALKNHADYVRNADAWMLSTFVLPVGKFSAARQYHSWFDREHPLRISALAGKSTTKSAFDQTLSDIVAGIAELRRDNETAISVVQLEIALPLDCDLETLGALQSANEKLGLRIFCEAPADQAERTIALLAEVDTTRSAPLGFKLRTGGVTADAFPASGQIARALVAAGRDSVPIKFTAGLHHPIRQFRDEVNGKMHGFLNVLGAGVLAAEHGWDEGTTAAMLDDESFRSFVFNGETFAWREWKISAQTIRERRRLVTSFGSCSFDEPREDLRALGWL